MEEQNRVMLGITVLCSFCVGVLLAYVLIPALRRLKAGQEIREVGPNWHATKAGTPTMGGLVFIGASLLCLLFGLPQIRGGDFSPVYVLALSLCFGLIGFLDDFFKVKYHRNLGLTALQKAMLQMAASGIFLYVLYRAGLLSCDLYIPFANVSLPVHPVVYMVFAMFVMVGCWCVLRVIWIQIMVPLTQDIRMVFWSYPITWVVSVTILTIYFFKVDWLHKGRLH